MSEELLKEETAPAQEPTTDTADGDALAAQKKEGNRQQRMHDLIETAITRTITTLPSEYCRSSESQPSTFTKEGLDVMSYTTNAPAAPR